jgi:hypothetical protein
VLDQDQERRAAANQLDIIILCENLAGVFDRPGLNYVEAAHVHLESYIVGVLE